jgi:hypothetical protein
MEHSETISIPIIIRRKGNSNKIVAVMLLMTMLVVLLYYIYEGPKWLVSICIGSVIILAVSAHFLDADYSINGYISLYDEAIEINTSERNEVYRIQDISSMSLSYKGVDGDIYWNNPTSLFRKDGTNNIIKICHQNEEYCYELLLGNDKMLHTLKRHFQKWKKINEHIKWRGWFQ